MKRIISVVAVAAVVLSGMAAMAAAEEPTALPGTFNIPFKHDLLGAHPRLLYSKEDMARWAKAGQDDEKFIWDAGNDYFKVCASPIPTAGEPWNQIDTDNWQRLGWWRGVTTLLLYARTGNQVYARNAIDLMMAICKSEHWELGSEQDYGMGTGHLMATVALIYDTTYDLLTDAQRQIVRHRLWLAADRMYNYGFNEFRKIPNASVRYWEQDPQNNHRWHRLCGYMLACLAIYGEEPGIDGYLDSAIKEAKFIEKWLPDDGSNHEGVGYTAFGMQFLVPAFAAMDRCLGTETLKDPGFHEAPYFRAHMITPDGQHMWNFGDGDWGTYYFAHYNFKLAAEWRDPMAQALHLRNFQLSPESYIYHGWTLLWYDPSLKPGNLALLPTWHYFPDLDIVAFRQSWTDPNALATFLKCGNYGGKEMNKYAESFTPVHYVNVAHDYPDANDFLFAWRGHIFATNTGGKQTRGFNTILVNGKGQDGEGEGYTQPVPNMGQRARIEQCFGAPGFGLVRGEAGGFYPDLSKFTRTFIYVDNAYLVVADDVKARKPAAIDWLYHSDGQWTEAGKLSWLIAQGQDKVRLSLAAAPAELKAKVAAGTQGRRGGGSVLTASYQGDRLRLVAVMAPQSAAPAEIVDCQETDAGFVLKIKRGDLIDLVAVGPTPKGEDGIKTDAEAAVVTLKDGKAVKAMIVAGKSLAVGDARLLFDKPSNALADAAGGKLTLSAPLGQKAGAVRCDASGLAIQSVNGQPVAAGAAEFQATALGWKELQDKLLDY
ncbi:MAG: DUF4962 domain-containing protein [Candidatus Brocadiia bacterium]|jgi:hypothetical protein